MKLTEAKLKQIIREALEITTNERKIADLLTGSADDANLGLSFMESLGMTPHIGKQSSGPHLSYPKRVFLRLVKINLLVLSGTI